MFFSESTAFFSLTKSSFLLSNTVPSGSCLVTEQPTMMAKSPQKPSIFENRVVNS
jgi:hypothetical protein